MATSSDGGRDRRQQDAAALGLGEQLRLRVRARHRGDRGLDVLQLGRALLGGRQPQPERRPVPVAASPREQWPSSHTHCIRRGAERTDHRAEQQRDRHVAVAPPGTRTAGATARRGCRPTCAGPPGCRSGPAARRGCAACSTACWADTSTCWPRPLVARSVRASNAPTAASAPACSQACGTDVRTGARSLSPLSACEQPAARIVRSDAAQSALGPSRPNARHRHVDAGRVDGRHVGGVEAAAAVEQDVGVADEVEDLGVGRADDATACLGCRPRTRGRRRAGGAGRRRAARRARPRRRARPASSRPPGRGGPSHRSPGTRTTSAATPIPAAGPGPASRPEH